MIVATRSLNFEAATFSVAELVARFDARSAFSYTAPNPDP